jgi:hypothetical protein
MCLQFLFKLTTIIAISIIIRGVLPRYRIDQLIAQNWRFFIFLLLSFFFFFVTALTLENNVQPWHNPTNLSELWILYAEIKPNIDTAEFWLDIYRNYVLPKIFDLPFIIKHVLITFIPFFFIVLANILFIVSTACQWWIDLSILGF